MIRPLATLGLVVAALVAAAPSSAQSSREPYPGFDAYVTAALKTFDVPGAAIAIVRNDSVIFARGYGVRDIDMRTPVDERTLFAIGSASKAFTVASIGMLVEEGKLRWDDRAAERLPGFELFDPAATREVSGTSWEDFVARRIFAPLGMTSSSTSITALTSQSDVASPHMRVDDTLRVVPWRNIGQVKVTNEGGTLRLAMGPLYEGPLERPTERGRGEVR